MCGIVGYVGKKEVVPVIIEGLRRLEYRGYDSAGIAVAGNSNGLQIRRAEGKLRTLEDVIRQKPLTDGPVKKTPTLTATAPAQSSSFITASSKTTCPSRRS